MLACLQLPTGEHMFRHDVSRRGRFGKAKGEPKGKGKGKGNSKGKSGQVENGKGGKGPDKGGKGLHDGHDTSASSSATLPVRQGSRRNPLSEFDWGDASLPLFHFLELRPTATAQRGYKVTCRYPLGFV